ncbi:MAG: DUF2079 domain-containing protein, partial [Candidatus Micrarchaeaceae archaeon]
MTELGQVSKMGKLVEYVRNHSIPILILFVAIALYNYFWDMIAVDKIFSFTATVWDMGAFYFELWQIAHELSVQTLMMYLAKGPIGILMSPLSFIDNPFFFVYLQTFAISATALPLYLIASVQMKSKLEPLILSVSYLLFFGIAGPNWFDLHFQTFFIPLFVTGYALHLVGRKWAGTTVLLLSGLVRFPYMIFPLIFFAFSIYDEISIKREVKIGLINYTGIILSILFLIMGYVLTIKSGPPQSFLGLLHPASYNVITNFTSNIDDKIFTFLLLLSPFMMLPLLSRRWTIPILVYVALVFYSGAWQYIFPGFDHLQYNSMVVPFLFLGTIDVLSNFDFNHNGKATLEQKKKVAPQKKPSGSKRLVVLTIFVLIVLLGTVYEPYGPLNKYSETDFNLGNVTNYNISLYEGYLKLVDLIPT